MPETITLAELDINLDAVTAAQVKYLQQIEEIKASQKALRDSTGNLEKASKEEGEQYVKNEVELKSIRQEYTKNQKILVENKDGVKGLTREIDKEIKTKKEAKENNKFLRKAQEEVNITTQEGIDTVAAMNKKIDENTELISKNSDSNVQAKINVGKYRESLEGLVPGLSAVTAGLEKTTVGSKVMSKAFLAIPIIAVVAAFVGLVSIMAGSQEVMDKIKVTLAGVTAGFQATIGAVRNFGNGLVKFISGNKKGIEEMGNAFEGFGDKVEVAMEKAKILASLEIEYRKLGKESKLLVQSLESESELYRQIRDDSTRSFEERENANQKAIETDRKLFTEKSAQAKRELEIIKTKADAQRANGKLTDELTDAEIDGMQAVNEALNQQKLFFLETDRERSMLIQDRLEKDLDILIDGFDNQKTINERRILDERLTLEERKAILDETQTLADDSLAKQVETIQKFTSERIDINELLQESDAVVLNEKIRGLGLSEIIEGRLLEVIRDRKTAEQDLAEVSADLIKQEMKSREEALNERIRLEEQASDRSINIKQLEFDREEALRIRRFNQEINDAEAHGLSLKNLKIKEIEFFADLDKKRIREEEQRRLDALKKETEQQIAQGGDMGLIIEEAGLQKKIIVEETEDAITAVNQNAADDRLFVTQDENRKKLDAVVLNGNLVLDAVGELNNLRRENIENNLREETAAVNKRYNKEIEAAGDNKDLISQIEAEKQQALNEINFKAAEQRHEQEKREIRAQIASAILNGLAAVVAASAPPPIGGGPIAGIAIGIATGIRIKGLINKMKSIQNAGGPSPSDFGLGEGFGAGEVSGSSSIAATTSNPVSDSNLQSQSQAGAGNINIGTSGLGGLGQQRIDNLKRQGFVVDERGNIIGKKLANGDVVDTAGNVIGIIVQTSTGEGFRNLSGGVIPLGEKGALVQLGGERHTKGGNTIFDQYGNPLMEAEKGELLGVMSRPASEAFMAFNKDPNLSSFIDFSRLHSGGGQGSFTDSKINKNLKEINGTLKGKKLIVINQIEGSNNLDAKYLYDNFNYISR